MSNQELDMFGFYDMVNPLKGKRVCLTGEFRMPNKELNAKLKAVGVDKIDRVSETRIYKEEDAIPPVKESTHFFIVGSNPNEESIKRYALNEHDGFHAVMINEDKLYMFLNGQFSEEDKVPETVEKKLNIDIGYYNWKAPVINGKTFVSRLSSPLEYVMKGWQNPIYQKEIYVPDMPSVDMDAFRQIIGNLGGYANRQYYDDTNIVMLGVSTLQKLEQGIKDDVIIEIENQYNNSNAKIFNVQFTCESDFIKWVEYLMERYPDESTINYLNIYKGNKKQ